MKKISSQTGGPAVEFALILPLLVLLTFGIIEFSLILYNKAVITNASREGARAGIVSQSPRVTDAEITAVVDGYCKNYLVTFGAANNPVSAIARSGMGFGDELTVSVSHSYGFLVLPNFASGITGPVNLTATTVMRME